MCKTFLMKEKIYIFVNVLYVFPCTTTRVRPTLLFSVIVLSFKQKGNRKSERDDFRDLMQGANHFCRDNETLTFLPRYVSVYRKWV